MIKLTIHPETFLVSHEGVPDGMMLRVEPKTFGAQLTLSTLESERAREERERAKEDLWTGLARQAASIAEYAYGKRPCHGCGGTGVTMRSMHRQEFEVLGPDGVGHTFEPGVYEWVAGELPRRVGDVPENIH